MDQTSRVLSATRTGVLSRKCPNSALIEIQTKKDHELKIRRASLHPELF
ncbi:hypothetical protein LINGRAHAP2_LOCUS15457 [Linum grandiflorum]